MPQVETKKRSALGKRIWLVVAVILLAVVGIGAGIYGVWYFGLPTPQKAVAEADSLNEIGKYDAALEVLKKGQRRAQGTDDKVLVLSRLAATMSNKGNLEAALEYYDELLKLKPNDYPTLLSAAERAEQLNRRDEARGYYERALTALEALPDDPFKPSQRERLQALIEVLK